MKQTGVVQQRTWRIRGLACALIACGILTMMPVIAPTAAQASSKTGKVTATELNIRKSASSDAEKLRSVKEGTKLTILDTDGDWYKVSFGKTTGYVAKKYVSVSSSETKFSSSSAKSGGDIASLGAAPKATKPGDNNSSVEKLQEALTLAGYYQGRISGNYGDLTEKAVKAYHKAKGLSVDGIAGNGTIKALFGESAKDSSSSSSSSGKKGSTPKTEKLDWYKDEVTDIIPKNAVFTIKDVRSGRTFKARRWSGGAHIDAEPVKKADTATMKKCYGGAFSWNRRPILISYNGHVYAASMNGMPHGDSTINNNGFDGVFCIHFYKSKTHETNRVDAAHQACVKEAAKATW